MAAPVERDLSYYMYEARDQAVEQSKTALREKNKSEWTCDLTIMGNPLVVSGITFMVEGFGEHDGKYIVETAAHTLDGSYTTKITGRRVLEGY